MQLRHVGSRLAAAFMLLTVMGAPASAGAAPVPARARFVVYTKPSEPFVFVSNGTAARGLSVDLWTEIARRLHADYQTRVLADTPAVLAAVRRDPTGIGIAAISITSERERTLDFSHPYFESGLQVLTTGTKSSSLVAVTRGILSGDLLRLLFVILVLSFVTANLIWVFERRRNEESFPQGYWLGISEALWFAVSTLFAGGCEEKSPRTFGGRFTTFIWLIASIILVAYFTASLTAALTVDRLAGGIKGPDDLPGKTVATVRGSTSEHWLTTNSAKPLALPDVTQAVEALAHGEAQAVVYDFPLLRYQLKVSRHDSLHLVGRVFEKQDYGLALPVGSPYRKQINAIILELSENGFLDALSKQYLGEDS